MKSKKEEKERLDRLAAQVRLWETGALTPRGWQEAPEAVPLAKGTVSISLRLPARMLYVVRELARRRSIGYQVLLKQWLDERLLEEYQDLKEAQRTVDFEPVSIIRKVASFQVNPEVRLIEDFQRKG